MIDKNKIKKKWYKKQETYKFTQNLIRTKLADKHG